MCSPVSTTIMILQAFKIPATSQLSYSKYTVHPVDCTRCRAHAYTVDLYSSIKNPILWVGETSVWWVQFFEVHHITWLKIKQNSYLIESWESILLALLQDFGQLDVRENSLIWTYQFTSYTRCVLQTIYTPSTVLAQCIKPEIASLVLLFVVVLVDI